MQSGRFLQWGSTGKFFISCRIQLKSGLRVRLKYCNDREEFELDRAKCKNNIAETSFTPGHETHNSSICSSTKHYVYLHIDIAVSNRLKTRCTKYFAFLILIQFCYKDIKFLLLACNVFQISLSFISVVKSIIAKAINS